MPEEFGNFIVADPVMLRVIHHRDQHREMTQQVTQAQDAGQRDHIVLAGAPGRYLLVQGMPCRGDVVAQGLEQASQQGFAPSTGEHGKASLQGEWRRGQFRSCVAPTAERRAKHLAEGHTEAGGGDVWPVVHIGLQHKVGTG
jgi:hypothetical protein